MMYSIKTVSENDRKQNTTALLYHRIYQFTTSD